MEAERGVLLLGARAWGDLHLRGLDRRWALAVPRRADAGWRRGRRRPTPAICSTSIGSCARIEVWDGYVRLLVIGLGPAGLDGVGLD
jgi:hypothetical protein